MSWARIDDGFDDHPKVLALLDNDQGASAIGLWTLCLTWAHRNTRKRGKVPGQLPASLPRRYLGPGARELAELLVAEKLWEDCGPDGWMIHDFERYLPTEQTRDARSEAGKRGAEARWGKRAGRNGNLPSGDGKDMAAGCDDDAINGRSDADAPAGRYRPPGDGKEPSGDSNLPSDLPIIDGKGMASDGSRTPARRAISNEIAPTPAPTVPPTAGTAKPRRKLSPDEITKRTRHVGEIVAAFVDGATENGLKAPPASLRSRVGRQAKDLLAEDWDIDFLINSARHMGATEFNDLATQVRKDDAAAARANGHGPPGQQESTGAQRAQAALEAGLRVQAMLDERNAQ